MASSLSEYRKKRDFQRTPEPAGTKRSGEGRLFVVQEHAATRLHYDFRLELDGTLKSWAVPKGPSLDPGEVRLALRVEDHPVDYGDFEGAIPKGQYGGGTVVLWDRGLWEPVGEHPARDLALGKLELRLYGEKLAGRWLLVRSSRRGGRAGPGGSPGEKEEWLLRKLPDRHARPGSGAAVLDERPESVASGLTLEEMTKRPPRVWQSRQGGRDRVSPEELRGLPGAREAPFPDFVEPQLATLVREPAGGPGSGEAWLHEIKLDGYRILCRIEEGRARLLSRRGHDWTDRFPAVASQAPFLAARTALVDGEVVYLRPDGTTDFQALQKATGTPESQAPVYYVAFDLLHLDGYDLTRVPLVDRKALLRRLLDPAPAEISHLRYGEHVEGDGREFFDRACDLGLEGTVSKRPNAPYRSGRSRDWVKAKCIGRQELVIVGWSDPEGSRTGFGSLLLGYHDEDGRLTFAGRVGTGFDERTLAELHRRLLELERRDPPVDVGLQQARSQARGRKLHWAEPRLVAEVAFTEWTRDGVLRHPSFQGLREDKDPREVGRERPRSTPEAPEAAEAVDGGEAADRASSRPAAATAPESSGAEDDREPARRRGRAGNPRKVAGVRITNPDRVLWPDAGITKGDLVDYVAAMADAMLPHVAGRPLTLVRCPTGIDEGCFYQKHLAEGVPEALTAVEVEERKGSVEIYVTADGVAGLVTLAQLGVLEIHPWGSRVEHLDRPDRLVFDLDPGPGVPWSRVVASAHDLRTLLDGLGLASFARTTGGKGVHVVVPLVPEVPWDRAKALTRAIAGLLGEGEPGLYTTNPLKSHRQGKIFVDYLRNAFGATAIATYATRARPGAPVATPVAWDELTADLEPARFDLRTVPERLRSLGEDPWTELLETRQRLRPEIRDRLA